MSVLLMGTGTYPGGTPESMLPAIPAVHDTLHDLKDVLIEQCRVDSWAIQVVEDPATNQDMGLAIIKAAAHASELLLHSDGTAQLWDMSTAALAGTLTGHDDAVTQVAFSPDGERLATASNDRTVRLWDVQTRRQLGEPLAGHHDQVRAVTFGPDSHTLVSAGADVIVWNLRHLPTPAHTGPAKAVAFRPGGRQLVTVGNDGAVRLWDVARRAPIGTLQPTDFPPGAAPAVAAGDGTARVTVNDDQFVRLWDGDNQLQATLYGHRDVVLDAAFSDDRHTLATVSRDGALMVWGTNPDRVAIEVCEALGVELTSDQWNNYITGLPHQKVCG